ncbi:hypothetical protein QG37_04925 [Candidozyma auris]|uniref:Uncharacterized protein n=1 Tax=Candidozyma auris TaxID=498019 RepID=A0A0L0NWY9_CANAR|nr:hypothetical protein QG37_04925 [[Candida] auris]
MLLSGCLPGSNFPLWAAPKHASSISRGQVPGSRKPRCNNGGKTMKVKNKQVKRTKSKEQNQEKEEKKKKKSTALASLLNFLPNLNASW